MCFCYVKFLLIENSSLQRAVLRFSFILCTHADFSSWNIVTKHQISRQSLSLLYWYSVSEWGKKIRVSFCHTRKMQFFDAEEGKIQRQFHHSHNSVTKEKLRNFPFRIFNIFFIFVWYSSVLLSDTNGNDGVVGTIKRNDTFHSLWFSSSLFLPYSCFWIFLLKATTRTNLCERSSKEYFSVALCLFGHETHIESKIWW